MLAGGTWAIRVASAGEIGCGVRGYVVREEGLSTRETRVAKSREAMCATSGMEKRCEFAIVETVCVVPRVGTLH